MAQVFIGTSGWHYDHWRGAFYPPQTLPSERLRFYSRWFPAVEVNNSFYRLPSIETFQSWRDDTPADFTFAVKASRFITHMKKLKDPAPHLALLFDRLRGLGPKLGPVLFQLPPYWELNMERFEAFLSALPKKRRFAFEFRHPSWHSDAVVELLTRRGHAYCIYDLAGRSTDLHVTAPFVYVRLHGPSAAAYQGSYSKAALAAWGDRTQGWIAEGRDVYIFFDNDQAGFAAKDAARLSTLTRLVNVSLAGGPARGPTNENSAGKTRRRTPSKAAG